MKADTAGDGELRAGGIGSGHWGKHLPAPAIGGMIARAATFAAFWPVAPGRPGWTARFAIPAGTRHAMAAD